MNTYSHRLAVEMEEAGHSPIYIKLCVQYAERLISNHTPVIFDVEHFSLVSGFTVKEINTLISNRPNEYREVHIKKKSKGSRVLEIPSITLKKLQSWILKQVLDATTISDNAKAFKTGLSILDNAQPHVRQECVYTIDIKDFFGSISSRRVHLIFRKLGYTKEMASMFTKICTYKNHLPQGSPTSPYLANLACKNLDYEMNKFLNGKMVSYTRYADDLTFSGNKGIVSFSDRIKSIVKKQGFLLNDAKTRVRYSNQRQMVTGLIVNQKLAVPKETIKKLRQEIYYCKKYGVIGHMRVEQISRSGFIEHLYGKAYFIKMVTPELGRELLSQLSEIHWEN
jgi:RNA-directed DNA polymerase